jgi:hypothetical protein
VQFGGQKSPESSEAGEEGQEESGILRQIRQLNDLKRMVIQNSSDGVQFHAGCTAVVALKHGNMLYVANAGDSRGVLCRQGELSTTLGAKVSQCDLHLEACVGPGSVCVQQLLGSHVSCCELLGTVDKYWI